MVGVIIQARMGSTRLPGKSMMDICGNPLLYYSTTRASMAKYVDKVVVATTYNKLDDVIEIWCNSEGFDCFRGSEDNVLDRYYQCAKQNNFDIIVRITADDPFIDPTIIDMLISSLLCYSKDFVIMRNKTNTWPYGLDVEVITFETLRKSWKKSTKPHHLEHVTTYIRDNISSYNTLERPLDLDLSSTRLTVDTKEDFYRASVMLDSLMKEKGLNFTWSDACFEYEKQK